MCIFLYLSYVIFEEDADRVENLTLNFSSIVGRFYFFLCFNINIDYMHYTVQCY